jgi:hypothetical protein
MPRIRWPWQRQNAVGPAVAAAGVTAANTTTEGSEGEAETPAASTSQMAASTASSSQGLQPLDYQTVFIGGREQAVELCSLLAQVSYL